MGDLVSPPDAEVLTGEFAAANLQHQRDATPWVNSRPLRWACVSRQLAVETPRRSIPVGRTDAGGPCAARRLMIATLALLAVGFGPPRRPRKVVGGQQGSAGDALDVCPLRRSVGAFADARGFPRHRSPRGRLHTTARQPAPRLWLGRSGRGSRRHLLQTTPDAEDLFPPISFRALTIAMPTSPPSRSKRTDRRRFQRPRSRRCLPAPSCRR